MRMEETREAVVHPTPGTDFRALCWVNDSVQEKAKNQHLRSGNGSNYTKLMRVNQRHTSTHWQHGAYRVPHISVNCKFERANEIQKTLWGRKYEFYSEWQFQIKFTCVLLAIQGVCIRPTLMSHWVWRGRKNTPLSISAWFSPHFQRE